MLEDVTLWDVGVERQIEISGPDAFTFANMMTPRDLAKCAVRAPSCGVTPRGRG
jgi:glycine cleavage system aminomethyltransferase T